jgi:hypothetical protein
MTRRDQKTACFSGVITTCYLPTVFARKWIKDLAVKIELLTQDASGPLVPGKRGQRFMWSGQVIYGGTGTMISVPWCGHKCPAAAKEAVGCPC